MSLVQLLKCLDDYQMVSLYMKDYDGFIKKCFDRIPGSVYHGYWGCLVTSVQVEGDRLVVVIDRG